MFNNSYFHGYFCIVFDILLIIHLVLGVKLLDLKLSVTIVIKISSIIFFEVLNCIIHIDFKIYDLIL